MRNVKSIFLFLYVLFCFLYLLFFASKKNEKIDTLISQIYNVYKIMFMSLVLFFWLLIAFMIPIASKNFNHLFLSLFPIFFIIRSIKSIYMVKRSLNFEDVETLKSSNLSEIILDVGKSLPSGIRIDSVQPYLYEVNNSTNGRIVIHLSSKEPIDYTRDLLSWLEELKSTLNMSIIITIYFNGKMIKNISKK